MDCASRAAGEGIDLASQPGALFGMHHVNVIGQPAQMAEEGRIASRLRLHAVLAAVVDDGSQLAPEGARHPQFVVDHHAGHLLALRSPDGAKLFLVDQESFLVADLVDPPAKPPQLRLLMPERKRQVIRIARVGQAGGAGESGEAATFLY